MNYARFLVIDSVAGHESGVSRRRLDGFYGVAQGCGIHQSWSLYMYALAAIRKSLATTHRRPFQDQGSPSEVLWGLISDSERV